MKTIGLLGGTTWESTVDYYRVINCEVAKRRGEGHAARIAMFSVDFHDVYTLASAGRMDELKEMICDAAIKVERAGADCLLVCANTLHMFADAIQERISMPLIHIVKATFAEVQKKGFSSVGLLGTKPTMEMDFYRDIFRARNMELIVPGDEERQYIHEIIFSELSNGIINEDTRQHMIAIMNGLVARGAQGIILGCTEIPLLVKQAHTPIPLFDTTYIHSCAGVDFALS